MNIFSLHKKISTSISLAFLMLLATLPLVYFFNFKVDEMVSRYDTYSNYENVITSQIAKKKTQNVQKASPDVPRK